MVKIDELKFDEKGLIPAVVTDFSSGKVLTVAYMNRESLEISMEKGLTCFWSRSRQELWLKGETSGNYQHIYSITADCDRDALVVKVTKDGPACHLGTDSCFNDLVYLNPENAGFTMESLMELIEGRKTEKKEGSYTTYLFEKGIDKILKKVGEESTEVIIAAKAGDKSQSVALSSFDKGVCFRCFCRSFFGFTGRVCRFCRKFTRQNLHLPVRFSANQSHTTQNVEKPSTYSRKTRLVAEDFLKSCYILRA